MAKRVSKKARAEAEAAAPVENPRSVHQDASLNYVAVVKQAPMFEGPPSKQAKQDTFADLAGRVVTPPLPPERLMMLYEECAPHAACINAKATDAVGQGWLLEPEATDAAEEPQEGGAPLEDSGVSEDEAASKTEEAISGLSRFLERVTPALTFEELLEQAAREQETVGWGVWEVARDPKAPPPTAKDSPLGDIAAIYPLPAHTMRVTKEEDAYVQIRGGKRVWFKPFGSRDNIHASSGQKITDERHLQEAHKAGLLANEVLVFKTYRARSPWYGVPRWISGIPTIAELTAIREYNISWHSSGGTTDRSVHVKAKTKAVAKEVARSIREQLEEAKGRGHVTLITSGTVDVEVTIQEFTKGSTGKRDGQFRNRREELIKELLMAHQTPPYRVGWAEIGSLGGSAAKEMLRAYREGAIEPMQTVIESRLNQTLFGKDGIDLKGYKFKLEELGWDTSEYERETAYDGVERGVLSPNDAREMIGEPRKNDDPALDDHYIGGASITAGGMPEGEEGAGGMSPEELLEQFGEALRVSTEEQQGLEQPPAVGDTITPEAQAG